MPFPTSVLSTWDRARKSLARSGHALLLHEPTGQNYTFVIRLMARVVAFLGRASGSALRTSVVNTALSCASVNFPGDATEVPLATPKIGLSWESRNTYGQMTLSEFLRHLEEFSMRLPNPIVVRQRVTSRDDQRRRLPDSFLTKPRANPTALVVTRCGNCIRFPPPLKSAISVRRCFIVADVNSPSLRFYPI